MSELKGDKKQLIREENLVHQAGYSKCMAHKICLQNDVIKKFLRHSMFIRQYDLSYSLALVHSITSWLVWAEIDFTVHVECYTWPKRTIKQFSTSLTKHAI